MTFVCEQSVVQLPPTVAERVGAEAWTFPIWCEPGHQQVMVELVATIWLMQLGILAWPSG